MRVIFGVLGLLIVVAIVGMVARQQLSAVSKPLPGVGAPAGSAGQGDAPAATPKQQVQQFQKAVEGAVQQGPRTVPDEK